MATQTEQEVKHPTPWSVSTAFQDANPELKCSMMDARGEVIMQHQDRGVLKRIAAGVNAHDALVGALRFTDNGHGHFAGCVRTTPAHPSRPCRKSCEIARAALAAAR